MTTSNYPRPFATYVLLERLGAGGMSEVDLARRANDDATGRFVVIKRIRAGSSDERAVRMFLDEARINAQLSHENIAQVYASGREGDEWYLEMEYIPGLDLRQLQIALARTGRLLPPRIAMTILCGVLRALHYAHARVDQLGRPMRIVHRDVNPRNVMVSSQGEVKLIDFGVARAAERLERTESNQVKGKFAYMAPEQIEANQEMDGRTDLYAVGLMLHELLTGKSPFANLADVQIRHRILSGKIPPLPDEVRRPNLEEWRAIHRKSLALSPDDRYADGDAFRYDVERALHAMGGPASAREIGVLLVEATGDKVREITDRLRGWHESSAPSLLPGNVAELRSGLNVTPTPPATPPRRETVTPERPDVAKPPSNLDATAVLPASNSVANVPSPAPEPATAVWTPEPSVVRASPAEATVVGAASPVATPPPEAPPRRSPWLGLALGLVGLAAAAGVAWGVLQSPAPSASPPPLPPVAPVAPLPGTQASTPRPSQAPPVEASAPGTRPVAKAGARPPRDAGPSSAAATTTSPVATTPAVVPTPEPAPSVPPVPAQTAADPPPAAVTATGTLRFVVPKLDPGATLSVAIDDARPSGLRAGVARKVAAGTRRVRVTDGTGRSGTLTVDVPPNGEVTIAVSTDLTMSTR